MECVSVSARRDAGDMRTRDLGGPCPWTLDVADAHEEFRYVARDGKDELALWSYRARPRGPSDRTFASRGRSGMSPRSSQLFRAASFSTRGSGRISTGSGVAH